MDYRLEQDSIGELEIEHKAYYGIYTQRAKDNFNLGDAKVNWSLIEAIIIIKKAAALTHQHLKELPKDKTDAIIMACDEILAGQWRDQFDLHPLQGGAGTSTNMNVNEVIANRAIEILGGKKGDYTLIHPLNDVNRSQSTNDVYPTALRIAAIFRLRKLSDAFSKLQETFQQKENEFADIIKLGRTQLMDALPIMVGQEFGAYAQAVARDRWRLYKVEERLRQMNIGGTAIGTGMNASKKYIYMMTEMLRDLTGLGLARAEFPIDITQNNDVFVEVSGLLKSAAVNVIKIANDLRLMSSGPRGGLGEIKLKPMQAGSSIMPGKVNPVIPEMVVQTGIKVISNDQAITLAASYGQFELNAFMPIIADSLLDSLEMMEKAVIIFRERCVEVLEVDAQRCLEHLLNSTALATALVHHIGYDEAAVVAKKALKECKTVKEILLEDGIMDEAKADEVLNPYQVTKPGIPGK